MLPGVSPVLAFAHFMGLWQPWKFYGNNCIWKSLENLFHLVGFLAVVTAAAMFVASLTTTYEKMSLTIAISWISDYVIVASIPILVAMTVWKQDEFRSLIQRFSDLNVSRSGDKLKKLDIFCRIAICSTLTIGTLYSCTAVGYGESFNKENSTITIGFFLASVMAGYFLLIYPIIIQVVFSALCILLAEDFKTVAADMSELLQNQEDWKVRSLKAELAWLRCYHQELCDLTAHLGRLFSPLMVVVIPANLVSIIINMFYFSTTTDYFLYTWLAVRVTENIFHLLVVFYTADCVSNQAKEMENVIQRYPMLNLNLYEQLQLMLFAQKTWKSCSALDVMGFFVISRDLVPAITGSFLTYVILLNQEYSTNH